MDGMTHNALPPIALSEDLLTRIRRDADNDSAHTLALNAVTSTSVDTVAVNRRAIVALDPTVALKTDSLPVTDQKQSGRCWMFATLNVFRHEVARTLGVESFEFSQAYLQFFDKMEKANYFLRAVAALYSGQWTAVDGPDVTATASGADVSAGGSTEAGSVAPTSETQERLIDLLYQFGVGDGGQWNFCINLINKYGAVPKYAMPETQSSSNTRHMDRALHRVLRSAALRLKDLYSAGQQTEATISADAVIAAALRDVHRVLSIHLGTPPTEFDWHYRTKDKEFHRVGRMTPREFAAQYLPSDLHNYVDLVHDPRPETPTGRRYTTQAQNNCWGTQAFTFLNVPLATLKEATLNRLHAGKPVYFACDVNRQFRSDLGVWDRHLMELNDVYGVESIITDPPREAETVALSESGRLSAMSKADRMRTAESRLTHAMVFTGVDEVDGAVRAWRVENSWGTKAHKEHSEIANGGFGTMSDTWFDDNVFHVVVHRDDLPKDLLPLVDQEPTLLPLWDPMV